VREEVMRALLALPYRVDLLRGEVIETPVSLVDSNAEWPAMAPMVLFGELGDRHALFVLLDRVP
jgi:hypothetical protein